MKRIIEYTKNRSDFKGVPITANYATNYWPFNWIDDDGIKRGLFKDILDIATRNLNLTLIMQDPLEENKGIWFRK